MATTQANKPTQISTYKLTACGIRLYTRHGDASEMAQMIGFALAVAESGVAHYVRDVFYDSKCSTCHIDLEPAVREGDPVANAILAAALEHVGQFAWFGATRHMGDSDD